MSELEAHPEAASVRVGRCQSCSAVHVFLLDAEGTCFASFAVPTDDIAEFCRMLNLAAVENDTQLPEQRAH